MRLPCDSPTLLSPGQLDDSAGHKSGTCCQSQPILL